MVRSGEAGAGEVDGHVPDSHLFRVVENRLEKRGGVLGQDPGCHEPAVTGSPLQIHFELGRERVHAAPLICCLLEYL
jgi:hypothetical protein